MNKVTRNVKLAAITASLLAVTGFAQAQNIDNWASGSGTTIARSGADASLCWRDSFWTPATAAMDCDGAIKPAARLRRVDLPQPVGPTTETNSPGAIDKLV